MTKHDDASMLGEPWLGCVTVPLSKALEFFLVGLKFRLEKNGCARMGTASAQTRQ